MIRSYAKRALSIVVTAGIAATMLVVAVPTASGASAASTTVYAATPTKEEIAAFEAQQKAEKTAFEADLKLRKAECGKLAGDVKKACEKALELEKKAFEAKQKTDKEAFLAGTYIGGTDGTGTDGTGTDGTAPLPDDADGDGVKDNKDNCPDVANSDQEDADKDEIGDACESAAAPTATSVDSIVSAAGTLAAKAVNLSGPRSVRKGRKASLRASVLPCTGHEGDLIELYRGDNLLASAASDGSCAAVFKVRIGRTASFRAGSSQQDADHAAATSNTVKVKSKSRRSR